MSTILSTREAYGAALEKLGDTYDFVVLDADLSKATQTVRFSQKYPSRFFNMGISEGDMMSTAAGMATCGKTVFASTFAIFAAGRAYEQIRNSIAYPGLNVKIGATHGGVLIGEDGASHQCIEDISLMRTLPGMTIVVPCDEISTFQAVEQAIQMNGPVYLRFGRFASETVYQQPGDFKIGKGNVLRDGTDTAIFAIGDLVCEALKAADMLAAEGVSAAVIDMHTIKPLDSELVRFYAEKTKLLITAEDHSIIGGLGGAVAEALAGGGSGARLKMVGIQDTFGCSGSKAQLAQKFGLTAQAICGAYKSIAENQ